MISGILILPDVLIGYEVNVKIHLLTSAWTFLLIDYQKAYDYSKFPVTYMEQGNHKELLKKKGAYAVL